MVKPQIVEPAHGYSTIARDEILARREDRTLALVNVMPAGSFKAGHIPGSRHLPVAEIETKARLLLPNLNQEIVVYCAGPS